jgi:hypothetical protein
MALLSLFCLFAPFPLLIIEKLLPFPFIIEELFKLFVVTSTPQKNNWLLPVVLGIVFSFSESILYVVNFFQLGNFENLPLRLVLTTSLHTFTFLLMYCFRSKKTSLFIALVVSMVIHFYYNQFVWICI